MVDFPYPNRRNKGLKPLAATRSANGGIRTLGGLTTAPALTIRPRLLLLTGCLLSAIAAIAQTSYSLESWQGDVRLTRSGRREQRLTRQTGRRLDATDQLRLQGRRSWANVRCPQGLVRWNEVRQSRSVAEICNPSGTISRDTGTRNGDSELLAIATCEFVPKTYFGSACEVMMLA